MARNPFDRALLMHIRRIIYTLKRKWGVTLTIYVNGPASVNPVTGERTQAKTTYTIKRAIALPDLAHRDFSYSIQFIRANSNFVQGGTWEDGDRGFIIDGADIHVPLKINDYLIFDNCRYDFKSVDCFEQNAGVFLVGRRVVTNPAARVTTENVTHQLVVGNDISGTRHSSGNARSFPL